MSRSMPRTASVWSNFLMTLRSCTWAMAGLSLGRAGGEAGNVVVHEEGVDDEGWRGGEERRRHDHAPLIDVGLDQRGDRPRGQHLLVGAEDEGHGIDEGRPAYGEGEDRRGDQARQGHRYEDLEEHL